MKPPDWHAALPPWKSRSAREWARAAASSLAARASWQGAPEHERRVGLWRLGVPFVARELVLALSSPPDSRPLADWSRVVSAGDRDAVHLRSDDERAVARALGCWARPVVARTSKEGLAVTVMSGLPGAGKDTWLARHLPGLPVVSLDRLRAELRLEPGSSSDELRTTAFARARVLLEAGRPFAWNATLLRRRERRELLTWLGRRGARVTLVSLEVSAVLQARRNRQRAEAVPSAALERLLARWEPVLPGEAHAERFFEDDVECTFADAHASG